MSETKHTPGPWAWVDNGGWYSLDAANGTKVADDGSACDEYNREIDPEDAGESGANARLIAAAPGLLSAGREALALLEGMGAGVNDKGYADLTAAIAAATGE